MQTHAPHVRHVRETLLSDNWYTLKKYTFELLRRDGRWQEQSREAYDRGNGAVILLYNREKRTVVLTRQFRFPVFTHGHDGYLIEAAAGLLDNASPEARIDPKSPFVTSGIRIGSPAVTRRGFKEAEVKELAGWMCDVLDSINDEAVIERIKGKVLDICARYPVYA